MFPVTFIAFLLLFFATGGTIFPTVKIGSGQKKFIKLRITRKWAISDAIISDRSAYSGQRSVLYCCCQRYRYQATLLCRLICYPGYSLCAVSAFRFCRSADHRHYGSHLCCSVGERNLDRDGGKLGHNHMGEKASPRLVSRYSRTAKATEITGSQ